MPADPDGSAQLHASRLAQVPAVASQFHFLERWIESLREYRGLPGVVIGVVADQQLVWARAFGEADLEHHRPLELGSLFRIASISKLFTATALLQLRDAGELRLDDPVERYLPWFELQRFPGDEEPITLRSILTHTSGLPREADFPSWSDRVYPSLEELRVKLPDQSAAHPVDTRWKYSNLALSLAGEVVAAVSGQSYAAYIQRQILKPLGMRETSVGLPAGSLREQLATGYGRRMPDGTREVRPAAEIQALDAAGGLCSSVRDLARFASLQFRDGVAGGKQILKGATLREMHRVHWLKPDWTGGWGLGFSVTRTADRVLVGHGGWLEGYQSTFSFSPAEKIGVIVLTNADDGMPYVGHPFSITDRVYRWVAPELARAMRKPDPSKPIDPSWKQYTGLYRNAWGDLELALYHDRLVAFAPTELDPSPGMLTLVPVGPATFRTESSLPFGEDGEIVRFEVDGSDQVTMIWGANRRVRTRPG